MKLSQGVFYFPGILTEAQCPDCSRVLQWMPTESRNRVKAICCDKIFTATLNYVGITINDIETKKSNPDQIENMNK
jgi:hypothetical protein